jgi:hypothetical protein
MVSELRKVVEDESEFEVAAQRVDFYGWCSGCSRDRASHGKQSPS